jgi:hypothetical protein
MATWVISKDLQNEHWTVIYVNSLYWAVITMITVGYGDIVPISMEEKLYNIIVTLISCGVFACNLLFFVFCFK